MTSKDGTEAKYLNLDGSATIDLVNFGQDQEIDLISQRQSYNEVYADPESFQVNLDVNNETRRGSVINIKNESSFSIISLIIGSQQILKQMRCSFETYLKT